MLKKFAKSIRQYRRDSLLSPVFMVLEVLMEVLIPFFMANIIDIGIANSNMNYIIKMSILLIIFALMSLIFGSLSAFFSANAAGGFAANLRHDVFVKIQGFSFSNIDKFSSASLITRLTTDVTNIQLAYQAIIRQAVRAVVMITSALILSFRINAQISLIFLCIAPFLGFGLFFIILNVHPVFVRAFKAYDKLNNIVQENLHGIRVVKSYVREDTEKKKFMAVSDEIYQDFTKAQKRVAFNMPILQFCIYACMILTSWIGAKLISSGSMSTGGLMSILTYTMQILMSLMLLSIVFVMIIISRTSAKRVFEVLSEEPDIKSPDKPVMAVKDGSISVKSADFSYVNDADKLCLSGINLDISPGETIGIVGGTGSGKTSLVMLIPRLYDVTCGAVFVGGRDVREYDIETLRSEVAVVPQNNILFSGTIKENLRWGNEHASDEELSHACRLAQADSFIEAFPDGYDTYIEQGGTNVSGGQRQRLCIARALLKQPKILILDDSTSAVDTKTDAMIRKAFKEEIADTTKIIIAQRVLSVMDADKIVVMDNGGVSAVGSHEELLKTSRIYSEVYQSQIHGGGDFDE